MSAFIKNSLVQIGPVGGQTVDFSEVGNYNDHKIWIKIHVDSYKSQGRAQILVWSQVSLTWNEIHSMIPEKMKTDSHLGYRHADSEEVTIKDFAEDRFTLIEYMLKVLG